MFDPPVEWIPLVEDQVALKRDERSSSDVREDLSIGKKISRIEPAADDTLLHPHLARSQLAVGGKAGKLRTGTCPTRRTVIGFPRAEHKVPGIRCPVLTSIANRSARDEQLDMVDEGAICSGDTGAIERLPDLPGILSELLDTVDAEILPVIL